MTDTGGGDVTPLPWVNGFALTSANAVVSRFVSRMRIDAWTAEVVTALRRRGVQAVLLKGPAIARWLYADESIARMYSDVDLLVAPDDFPVAEAVLAELGFGSPNHPKWLMPHARSWTRPSDGASIDLHRTLHSMEALAPERVWREVITESEACQVHGVRVDIPGPVMRTLHIVLHLRPTEDPRSQASEDLVRALAHVDRPTWQAAAGLARRLGIEGEMGLRMRNSADGRALADELGLPTVGSLRSYVVTGLEQSSVPEPFYLLSCLASITSFRAKLRWLLVRQFPSRDYMEQRYPSARLPFGLPLSYGVRAAQTCARSPAVLIKWIRFNRRLKRTLGGNRPLR